ncbi:histidine phosphatase family protein [Cupriavidus gilardii]|uniref:histidine phosphatase family protein n=1 Tax=Cupriavidus gilardii TaxID=82541 RepID=UPI0009ED9D3B|nr:histidine phosphatase family protein [Cupriavidus gilardii]
MIDRSEAAISPSPRRRKAFAVAARLACWTLLAAAMPARMSSALAQPIPTLPVSALARPNVVVLLRHATAPGVGDPPGFDLNSCPTQRNLDASGRAQAQRLGAAWRAAGFRPSAVWASAWCRCQDTARLMDLGPVTVLPLLNSFFGDAGARTDQTAELSRFIDRLDPRGGPYLMVTHQVNITALTGQGADSGGGVVFELSPDGQPRRLYRLPAG